MSYIPYARQKITHKDIRSVVKVLKSNFLTDGPKLPQFEKSISSYVGSDYSVATNSATSALHLALLALGVGPGDLVWTSPISFVASANCALYCGAEVDFVDIDPKTFNISIDFLEEKLKKSEKLGKLPKLLIAVHFAGQSCEMKKIFELSTKYKFKIIEDASHALGGEYRGEKIGSCRYSNITIFSFHPVKIITTGEGGIATTNSDELRERMSILRSHGITKDRNKMNIRPDNEIWNYQQLDLGFNFRMTEFQAALGSSQLNKVEKFIKVRHKIADKYLTELSFLSEKIVLPWQDPDCYSSFHLFPIRIKLNKQRDFYNYMWKNYVQVNIHYIPIYKQPYFEKLGFDSSKFPEANKYFQETISLPIYPGLKPLQQRKIIKLIENFFR